MSVATVGCAFGTVSEIAAYSFYSLTTGYILYSGRGSDVHLVYPNSKRQCSVCTLVLSVSVATVGAAAAGGRAESVSALVEPELVEDDVP